MSYSFTLRAATKTAMKALVAEQFDQIVRNQACHAVDRAQAQAAVESFIDLAHESPDEDLLLNAGGTVSGPMTGQTLDRVNSAGMSVGVHLVAKLPPELS